MLALLGLCWSCSKPSDEPTPTPDEPVNDPTSLVINENSEPTLECTWSEAVGAPRAAKVTRHEVEPLATQSDLIEVKVIKTFRF